MKTSSENTTSPTDVSFKIGGIIFCSAFTLEAVLIIVGNLLAIVLFAVNQNLRKKSLFLVVNMAFADLLLGAVSLPIYIYFVGGETELWPQRWSAVFRIFFDVFMQASVISAVLISCERFYAIHWPLKHRTLSSQKYRIAILIAWILAFLVSAILFFLFFVVSIEGYLYFWLPYTIALIFLMCGFNISVWRKCQNGRLPQIQQNRASQNQRLTKTLLMISVLALLSWIPLTIMNILMTFPISIDGSIYYMAVLSNISNSIMNPIVYALRIPEFRQALGLCCRGKETTTRNMKVNVENVNRAAAFTPTTHLKSVETDFNVENTKL